MVEIEGIKPRRVFRLNSPGWRVEIDQPGPATTLNPGGASGFLNRRGFGGVLVRARGAIVGQHRGMTPEEFSETFALCHCSLPFLARANVVNLSLVLSPEPNVPIVTLIGYQVAGIVGAMVATLSIGL